MIGYHIRVTPSGGSPAPGITGTMVDGVSPEGDVHERYAYFGYTFHDDCGPHLLVFLTDQAMLAAPESGSSLVGAAGLHLWYLGGVCQQIDGGDGARNVEVRSGTFSERQQGTGTAQPWQCPLPSPPEAVKGSMRVNGGGWSVEGNYVAVRCALIDDTDQECI